MRVVRVYHAGRDPAHRARERALTALGIEVTLVVPRSWPESGAELSLSDEPFEVIELETRRAGDVNRHVYRDPTALVDLLSARSPDVLDVHEEPFSLAARQWLRVAGTCPVTMYTAQNVDKRLPPPFAQYETATYRRVQALYPCTRQAAAVARGKGFAGRIEVLPLGVDPMYSLGAQAAGDHEIRMGIVGRWVPEKGIQDAIRVLASLRSHRPTRLLVIGAGPEGGPAGELARAMGVAEAVEFLPWQSEAALARLYRGLHVVLVPSTRTQTWVEQFGRIILEAQASGAVVAGYASGAIPEVGGPAAVLVPEGDVDGLALAVRATVDDACRYTELRARGAQQASAARWDAVASRQAQLYEDVLSGRHGQVPLPRSPRLRRRMAVAEFGQTATLSGGVRRPFAAPVLRRDAAWTRAAGRVVDALQEGALSIADRLRT
ncbi:glycosyltransferase family 4 protein [Geodermatophilus sp. SYSU D01036]